MKNNNEFESNCGDTSENAEFQQESSAARRLRMLGEMGEAEPEPEIRINKWDNFWYHNKTKVIMIAAFTFIILVAVVQFAVRQTPDICILYAGPEYITANENKAFCAAVAYIMEDYDGDGKKTAQLNDFVFMTQNQLEELKEYAEKVGEELLFDPTSNTQTKERYSYEVFGGNSVICILSEEQYLEIRAADGFIPLSELLGSTPEYSYDECGVRLSDTKFCKFYDSAKVFPDDAVIALRRLSTMSAFTGKKKAETRHEYHKDLFLRILNFEYPEGYTESEE